MGILSPDDIQNLVAKAFVLEAITDKPGCTTRYEDLPGKPLEDFVVAGINSSLCFRFFAKSLIEDPNTPIFSYSIDALKMSNTHKSKKYINFGLLEIMFLTVYARLNSRQISSMPTEIVAAVKSTSNKDVQYLLDSRKLAWSTSAARRKSDFNFTKYRNLDSAWSFYESICNDYDEKSSNFQWANQFVTGLPVLSEFLGAYLKSNEIMKTTTNAFKTIRSKNSSIPVGILADMCAAAIFLWLSVNKTTV